MSANAVQPTRDWEAMTRDEGNSCGCAQIFIDVLGLVTLLRLEC